MGQTDEGIDLDTSLGYLLKQAATTLRAALDAVLRPLGMTVPQYSCLELLAQRPGLSNSELARGVFVSRQSMNVLLLSLQRDGLVTRADQPVAGRALPAELTALGRRRLKAASAAVRSVEDRMRSGLGVREQDQLRRALHACVSSLTPPR